MVEEYESRLAAKTTLEQKNGEDPQASGTEKLGTDLEEAGKLPMVEVVVDDISSEKNTAGRQAKIRIKITPIVEDPKEATAEHGMDEVKILGNQGETKVSFLYIRISY